MAQQQNKQVIQSTQVSTTSESTTNQTITAQFSNWNSYLSDVRKRYWDEKAGVWYWKIEDVQDADTPNINQLDIPIQQNERVEIRISSISEVGWPDSILESDWSNVSIIDFPDDINDVLSENGLIISEAALDQSVVNMDSTLNTKGVYSHIDDQFYVNNILYKHIDKNIAVSYKGDMNNTLNLFEYLGSLTDRIKSLEEIINKIQGELHIYLYKNDVLVKEIINNTTTQIKIECEDYVIPSSGGTRRYINSLYMIDDYKIILSNLAQNGNLGLLSNRNYTSGGTNIFYNDTFNQVLLVDYNDDLYPQQNNQFIWFMDIDAGVNIYSGITINDAPYVLNTQEYNIGSTGFTNQLYLPYANMNNLNFWSGTSTNLLTTLHPYFSDLTNIIETGQDKIKLIGPKNNFIITTKLWFKLDGSSENGSEFVVSNAQHQQKTRKIKTYFETSDGKTYQFLLVFNISNFRNYFKGSNYNTNSGYNYNNTSTA